MLNLGTTLVKSHTHEPVIVLKFWNDVSFVLKPYIGFSSYTSLPAQCFSTAERTGSPIFIVLWSIAKENPSTTL